MSSLLRELCPVRPADTVLLLRLLFEEDAFGRPSVGGRSNPRGTRPLTAGEISENWDICRDRCVAKWCSESRSGGGAEAVLSQIDSTVSKHHKEWVSTNPSTYADALRYPGKGIRSLIQTVHNGGGEVTVLLQNASVLADQDNPCGMARSVIWGSEDFPLTSGPLTLTRVSSVDEISKVVGSVTGDCIYISASLHPLMMLDQSMLLAAWAERHNTFLQRQRAAESGQLITIGDLFAWSGATPPPDTFISKSEQFLGATATLPRFISQEGDAEAP